MKSVENKIQTNNKKLVSSMRSKGMVSDHLVLGDPKNNSKRFIAGECILS